MYKFCRNQITIQTFQYDVHKIIDLEDASAIPGHLRARWSYEKEENFSCLKMKV